MSTYTKDMPFNMSATQLSEQDRPIRNYLMGLEDAGAIKGYTVTRWTKLRVEFDLVEPSLEAKIDNTLRNIYGLEREKIKC